MSGLSFFRLLAEVNVRIMRRNLLALRDQSYLMVSVISLFVLGYWVAGYSVFYMGFVRLAQVPGLQAIVLDRMLYLFFAFLFLMLMFSNMIIGYSTLFKSQETQWMLTLPVRSLDVFRWKLLETTLLASWAFLFLSAPLMVAYGNARHVSPSFYLKVFLLFVPFTLIPSALGSMAILVVTRYLHRCVFKWALFALAGDGDFLRVVDAGVIGRRNGLRQGHSFDPRNVWVFHRTDDNNALPLPRHFGQCVILAGQISRLRLGMGLRPGDATTK